MGRRTTSSGGLLRFYDQLATDAALWREVVEAGAEVPAVHRGEPPSDSRPAFWPHEPGVIASLGSNLAWAVADHVAGASVAVTCKDATDEDRWEWGWGGGPPDPLWQATRKEVRDKYPDLLREVVGNPFRPAAPLGTAVLAWEGGCVTRLAAAAYEERDFSPARMGILADALEEAGCSDADVLSHLRSGAEHVRGCWAVDLVLGKS